MKKEIKNNEVMNAVENAEVKNIEIEPIMNERQMLVRKYVSKVWLEKTGEKRGHYYVEIIMNNNTIYNRSHVSARTCYKYKLWSSGPWNNIEKA